MILIAPGSITQTGTLPPQTPPRGQSSGPGWPLSRRPCPMTRHAGS